MLCNHLQGKCHCLYNHQCRFRTIDLCCWVFACIQVAGIPPERLVEAHGTFSTATCTVCRRTYEGQELRVSHNPI